MVDVGIDAPFIKNLDEAGGDMPSCVNAESISTENREGRAPPPVKFVLKSDNAKAIHFTTMG